MSNSLYRKNCDWCHVKNLAIAGSLAKILFLLGVLVGSWSLSANQGPRCAAERVNLGLVAAKPGNSRHQLCGRRKPVLNVIPRFLRVKRSLRWEELWNRQRRAGF